MYTTIEDIINRFSIKKYSSKPVPHELIEQIIQAGLAAPSARNHQGTLIIHVKNKELRDQLSEDNRIIGERTGDPFYGAPTVLLVLGDKKWPYRVYDGSLVMGNMLNAIHALGLGGCWVNRCKEEFEMPKYQELLKQWGITEEYEGIAHCIIGYPENIPLAKHAINSNRVFTID